MRFPRRIRHIVDDLSGRSYRSVLEQLERQIETCLDGATLASRVAAGEVELAHARTEMAKIEQAGDSERSNLAHDLYSALTTPMDREDLFRLSRAIDDVLDNLRDYVRESHHYGVRCHRDAVPVFDVVALGLRSLYDGVRDLNEQPTLARERAVVARGLGNQVRRLYLCQMALLFAAELDIDLLKRRELLRRLDLVGQHLASASDALSNGLLKRSH